jgi:CRP/FNR family cyclic AMP-dependent transcriptional regulator
VTLPMLRKNAKIELLKRVPLFAGCSKRELDKIAMLADELDLPKAREITHQGAGGHEFLVIVDGSADVVRNGRVVNKLGPGDFFGEIALVSGRPRTAAVRTTGPARVLVVDARGFRTLMRDMPRIQTKVLLALAERIPHD